MLNIRYNARAAYKRRLTGLNHGKLGKACDFCARNLQGQLVRATLSVSKKTHADFEKYSATLSAKRGKVQTQEEVVRTLLEMAHEWQETLIHFCLHKRGGHAD